MKKHLATLLLATTLTTSVGLLVPNQADASSAVIVSSVNFRTGASVDSSSKGFLKAGETVEILSKINDYWYQVRDSKGETGYVSTSSQYIKESSSGGNGTIDASSAVIVSSVNFRTGASTDSSSIRFLKAGETVKILSTVNDFWYKVSDSKGVTGYVTTSSQYIKVSSSGGSSGGGSNSGGGNSGSGNNNGGSTNTGNIINSVIQAGKSYLGTPYEYGSDRSNTSTFDCSDFVRQAFIDGAKITLPSDSRQQGDYVRKIGKTTTNWKNLKVGDLMFFMDYKGVSKSAYPSNTANQRISHAGIYLGDGKILHTYSKDSGGVRIDNIEGKHWEYRFIFGGSAL
ncbi:Cell wall-associated hydrolase, NlpC family [Paenibacillus sp. 1_12]|uniref:C40 family peptidase n=1 Tax=Paenibacillus sp. 1_12 TaxID=1566278 RepID=UPI0008EDDE31|nr:C40 family peptidase [Paenibacillus sp. 1_12]SFM03177.1 Cell wall-associated hydrolase, NlpC family [Paenibacillus sp. 1_12]